MNIPKEAKEITLAILKHPSLHYKACYEDIAGRIEYNCICPLKNIIAQINNAEEK